MGQFDARMLGQAFANLIKNAVEAIEAVPADERPLKGKVLVRAGFEPAGDRYVVDVIDNGKGLPVENRHRILEPYMTMREKGTGWAWQSSRRLSRNTAGSWNCMTPRQNSTMAGAQ